MTRSKGSFHCPVCQTAYHTQDEADYCSLRALGEPVQKKGAVVRHTFFSMSQAGRELSEEFNRWRVLDPRVGLAPSGDEEHQYLVRVERTIPLHGATELTINVFPESELI